MKVVYIAGAFRAETAWKIAENIRIAERAGIAVARMGASPLIPHANTAHFHGELPDRFWLEATMELMLRCDAVLTAGWWLGSEGTRAELAEANRVGIPVFGTLETLRRWLEEQEVDSHATAPPARY